MLRNTIPTVSSWQVRMLIKVFFVLFCFVLLRLFVCFCFVLFHFFQFSVQTHTPTSPLPFLPLPTIILHHSPSSFAFGHHVFNYAYFNQDFDLF